MFLFIFLSDTFQLFLEPLEKPRFRKIHIFNVKCFQIIQISSMSQSETNEPAQ